MELITRSFNAAFSLINDASAQTKLETYGLGWKAAWLPITSRRICFSFKCQNNDSKKIPLIDVLIDPSFVFICRSAYARYM